MLRRDGYEKDVRLERREKDVKLERVRGCEDGGKID